MSDSKSQKPLHYLALFYPVYQDLDFSGPLDLLNMASKHPSSLAETTTLTYAAEFPDPVDIAPIVPPSQRKNWKFEPFDRLLLSSSPTAMRSGVGRRTCVDVTFAQILTDLRETSGRGYYVPDQETGAPILRPIDVLLVPGGMGSRMSRIDLQTGEKSGNVTAVEAFIAEVLAKGWVRHAVLTVCTGSDVLARTGFLDGRRATTNIRAFEAVSSRKGNQNVRWLRWRRWVRSCSEEVATDGKELAKRTGIDIWTSAGVSAGMDLTCNWLAHVYERDFARDVSRMIEYHWREEIGEGQVDPYYDEERLATEKSI